MAKIITTEQIQQVLGTFYATNISARDYNTVVDFFNALPEFKETPTEKPIENREPIAPRGKKKK